jgi:hypothetical protein
MSEKYKKIGRNEKIMMLRKMKYFMETVGIELFINEDGIVIIESQDKLFRYLSHVYPEVLDERISELSKMTDEEYEKSYYKG